MEIVDGADRHAASTSSAFPKTTTKPSIFWKKLIAVDMMGWGGGEGRGAGERGDAVGSGEGVEEGGE